MACDCIRILENKLRATTGDPGVRVDKVMLMNFQRSSIVYLPVPWKYTYRKRKRNGELSKVKTTGSVACTFCPICGARYGEDQDR